MPLLGASISDGRRCPHRAPSASVGRPSAIKGPAAHFWPSGFLPNNVPRTVQAMTETSAATHRFHLKTPQRTNAVTTMRRYSIGFPPRSCATAALRLLQPPATSFTATSAHHRCVPIGGKTLNTLIGVCVPLYLCSGFLSPCVFAHWACKLAYLGFPY